MTVEAVMDQVALYPCRLVEVTGGEPLLQKETPELIKTLLDRGYTVIVETSGSLDIRPIDPRAVIIMDINLGEDTLDGIEAMKIIRQMDGREGIQIFAITSYAMPEDKDKFLSLGFDRYFAKPYDKNLLIKEIQALDVKA